MAFLGASAQICLKKAMPLKINMIDLVTNYWLIVGVALYGLAFVGYLLVLRYAPVSQLYPIIAFSYLFVILLASQILSEPLTIKKAIGGAMIVFAVFLIGG